MEQRPESAQITVKKITHTYQYRNTDVLILDIEYPEISVPQNRYAEARINAVIHAQVNEMRREAEGTLYKQAVEDYIEAQKEGYPFNLHGLTVRYTITLNSSCTLSIYRDKYYYSGGAHGVTPRDSDTFDLCKGRRFP